MTIFLRVPKLAQILFHVTALWLLETLCVYRGIHTTMSSRRDSVEETELVFWRFWNAMLPMLYYKYFPCFWMMLFATQGLEIISPAPVAICGGREEGVLTILRSMGMEPYGCIHGCKFWLGYASPPLGIKYKGSWLKGQTNFHIWE